MPAPARSPWVVVVVLVALLLGVWLLAGERLSDTSGPAPRSNSTPTSDRATPATATRDLGLDEAAGGHTLARHVGRTDGDLARRLARERNLVRASTFTNREAAERAVTAALARESARVEAWLERPGGGNLVLRWPGDGAPLGRVLERGAPAAVPADAARVILARRGRRNFFVLTAYPEVRR